jgi:Copper binding periplasmic protein CusF
VGNCLEERISCCTITVVHLRIRFLLLAVCSLCCLVVAEESRPKTGIQFLGEVQSLDAAHHMARIKHVDIPGYEAQGTSDYYVDNKAVLNRLHPGDDIRATVYPNDRTLYNLRVVYRRRAKY